MLCPTAATIDEVDANSTQNRRRGVIAELHKIATIIIHSYIINSMLVDNVNSERHRQPYAGDVLFHHENASCLRYVLNPSSTIRSLGCQACAATVIGRSRNGSVPRRIGPLL